MDFKQVVTAKVANANDVRLVVTAELSLPVWKEIVSRIGASQTTAFYGPLQDPRESIRAAISEVENQVTKRGDVDKQGIPST